MKIPKELLGKMNADDKAELEGLTASEEAVYQEMEQYFNESLGRFKASQIIMGKVIAMRGQYSKLLRTRMRRSDV